MTFAESEDLRAWTQAQLGGLDSDTFLERLDAGQIGPCWAPSPNKGNKKAKGRPTLYRYRGQKLHGNVPRHVYDRVVKRVKAGEDFRESIVEEELAKEGMR